MKQRYILYILLVSAVLFGTLSYAETVESISYNPSRMGVFTYLKVQDEAVLRGGLTTPNLNINTTKATVQAADKIQTGVVTVSDLVEFTDAELSDSVTHDNYVYSNTPSNVVGTVNMNGGNAVVEEDSFINSLAHVGRVQLKALGTIYTPGVVIDGSYSNVPFVNGSGKGFKLGSYDIPLPTQLADGDTYEYVWQEMQFKDKKATVLTLQKEGASGGCTSDEDVVDRCGHSNGTWDDNNCTCICPQGTYWDTTQDWCEAVCDVNLQQDCEAGGHDPNAVPGTWNSSTCTCTCPAGSEFVAGDGCVQVCKATDPQYAQDADMCTYANIQCANGGTYPECQDANGNVPGFWSETQCRCLCFKGSYFSDGRSGGSGHCKLGSGGMDDWDVDADCYGATGWDCGQDDDRWDAYDEGYYDDWYDGYDYDYDYDYWD